MAENPQGTDLEGTDLAIARQSRKRHLAAVWAALAGLKPGMVVADIGCGPGVLTREYAKMVGPEGLVYAVDNKETYAELFQGLNNVRFLFQNYDNDIKLEQTLNIVFLTDRLQHVSSPETVLREVFKLCGSETKVLITGYDPNQPGRVGAKLHRRIAAAVLAGMIEAAGFRHGGVIESADEHYALIACR